MKIATFNINGIRARMPRLLEWLEESAPDIACLQEIKIGDELFPADELERAGYGAIWHGQKGFNGVAVLAKGQVPVERRRGLPDDPDPSHSRYLEAEVDGVVVASIYLPNGNPQPGPKFDYKLAWFDALIDHAQTLFAGEAPVVLAGDYNVIPTHDRGDIFSVTAMAHDALMQPGSQAAFRRLRNQGWTDALRQRHPSGPLYTFWDYQAGAWARDAGFRIDHLMLSPAAADRLLDAEVDRAARGKEKASDHAPVWITLR